MAALYSNENFPLKVVELLRTLEHDVLTSLEAGQANQAIDDEAVLSYATKINRALLTINRRGFVREHNKTPNHAGIIVCSQDPDVEGHAQRIHQAIKDNELLAGKLIRVNLPQK